MNAWRHESLWLKAKYFADKAADFPHDQPDFAFWSSLALECLARACLAKIHPALNADPRKDINLLYACGITISEQPQSLPAHSVYLRLEKCINSFERVHRGLCEFMGLLRNGHLHSGDLPFEGLNTGKWLSRYFEVCKILNNHLKKTLNEYLGSETARIAEQLIESFKAEVLKEVKTKISTIRKAFNAKTPDEMEKLINNANTTTSRLPHGSVVRKCPICGSNGELEGQLIKESEPVYDDGILLITETYVGRDFKCFACGLKLNNLEEISIAEIEAHFSDTRSASLHEFYEPDFYYEYDNM